MSAEGAASRRWSEELGAVVADDDHDAAALAAGRRLDDELLPAADQVEELAACRRAAR